jgi:hypothetical protein
MWAVSDLGNRMKGYSALASVGLMMLALHRIFLDTPNEVPYLHCVTGERAYGKTMHELRMEVRSRQWTPPPPTGSGFCVVQNPA